MRTMHAIAITKADKPLSLDDVSTQPRKQIDHEQIAREMEELEAELFELQDLMWGARTHSVLVVLQGRDTAGKDETIKRVVGALNPRGVHVVSFGVPTQEEREHDFLWRVHMHAPRNGEFAIFNRSHYEDVLVTRVHGLIDKETWQARYRHIVDFETLLADHGCIVLKFFLHISKKNSANGWSRAKQIRTSRGNSIRSTGRSARTGATTRAPTSRRSATARARPRRGTWCLPIRSRFGTCVWPRPSCKRCGRTRRAGSARSASAVASACAR